MQLHALSTVNENPDLAGVIELGLSFLEQSQLTEGNFTCYVSEGNFGVNEEFEIFQEGERKAWMYIDNYTIFPTTLIGFSLSHIKGSETAERVLTKIEDFLLGQKKWFDLWNHYTPPSRFYPCVAHDIDDTCCALAFLESRNRYKGKHMDIILSNRNREGLFYTWFSLRKKKNKSLKYWISAARELKHPILTHYFYKSTESRRNDVDGIVNANVIYYLGEREETQKAISHILEHVKNGTEAEFDLYYRNPCTIYYLLSKCLAKGVRSFEPIRQILIERILYRINSDGSIRENCLDTAMGLCALFNLNAELSTELVNKMKNFLLSQQLPSGGWPKRIFYTANTRYIVGWGSEELSTAIVLEALIRLKG
jgi:hypothetical protein